MSRATSVALRPGGVSVGAQPDQGLGRLNLQLGDEHAGGLADLRAAQRVQFCPGIAVGVGDGGLQVAVQEVQQRDAGELRGGDRTGQVLARQLARLRAEEVEGADIFAGHDDGYRVDASDLVGQHGGPVGGPSNLLWIGEVDDQNRNPPRDRVQARSLAEGELQFVVRAGGRAAGSQCSAARAVEDERNRRCVNVEENHAGLAQPVGGIYPAPPVDGGEELLVDRHI